MGGGVFFFGGGGGSRGVGRLMGGGGRWGWGDQVGKNLQILDLHRLTPLYKCNIAGTVQNSNQINSFEMIGWFLWRGEYQNQQTNKLNPHCHTASGN